MTIDFTKDNGLVPVIIQDEKSLKVLMLGYMNEAAFTKTQSEKKVTFYSRSKKRLWTKGETSGHFLWVSSIHKDCDQDALLIFVNAVGPTCHQGTISCFKDTPTKGFLYQLEAIISDRLQNGDERSYTKKLTESGLNKVAQKVGEEVVELIIEAKDNHPDLFKNEAADLIFHLIILLQMKGFSLQDIEYILESRHQ